MRHYWYASDDDPSHGQARAASPRAPDPDEGTETEHDRGGNPQIPRTYRN